MDSVIFTDVETGVMERITTVHVAMNPGQEQEETMVKDAVPPVQTVAPKIKMVKKTLFKKRNKNPNFFIPFIFSGNVDCTQGSVMRLGEQCPEIHQCLTCWSSSSKLICGDGHCSEEKQADQICRGIPNVACTNE